MGGLGLKFRVLGQFFFFFFFWGGGGGGGGGGEWVGNPIFVGKAHVLTEVQEDGEQAVWAAPAVLHPAGFRVWGLGFQFRV